MARRATASTFGRAELGLARTGAGEWDMFQVDPETSRQQLVAMTEMVASADAMKKLSDELRDLTRRFRTGSEGAPS